MCGINGIAALSMQININENDVRSMLPALHHRGPNGSGVYIDPCQRIGLGHTRLSIIDLAGGTQPMHNEDKTVWVTFNGEIFNYIELRETLIKEGHCFYSHSDTEVIVHAYEQYGGDFVQHLNGQFAIALWDCNRQRLLLVRDRVGILPLFYTRQGDRLLFASEIKALLPHYQKHHAFRQRHWIRLLPSGHRVALIPYLKIFSNYRLDTCWLWKKVSCVSQLIGTGAFLNRVIIIKVQMPSWQNSCMTYSPMQPVFACVPMYLSVHIFQAVWIPPRWSH